MKLYIWLGIFIVFPVSSFSQSYYRVEADFSIKESYTDSVSRLTMGRAYFDKSQRKIVYKLSFPQPETTVIGDSLVWKSGEDTTIVNASAPGAVDFSIFNLILSDELSGYGLHDSLYVRASVDRIDGLIVTTWKPAPVLEGLTGEVKIAKKGKLLHAVAFYSVEGDVLARQFFRKYQMDGGLPFPGEIVQVLKKGGKENYMITTFSNIRFDEDDTEGHYATPFAK